MESNVDVNLDLDCTTSSETNWAVLGIKNESEGKLPRQIVNKVIKFKAESDSKAKEGETKPTRKSAKSIDNFSENECILPIDGFLVFLIYEYLIDHSECERISLKALRKHLSSKMILPDFAPALIKAIVYGFLDISLPDRRGNDVGDEIH